MKIAAAYIRVSTDDQLEYSPDSQLKIIRDYAKRNDIILPEEFIFMEDDGISGRKAEKRPAFMRMIGTAKKKPKPFDVILLWKFSRFARNREDSVVYKSMLRTECGIDVVSVNEQLGDDKTSILIEALIEAMDEYYSINLSEEVKRGMTEKASRGGVVTGPALGYVVKDRQYTINPKTAPIVQMIFTDFINGTGCREIATKLNDMKLKTIRGNNFENRTVEYIIRNPVYIGKIRWNPSGRTRRDYSHPDIMIVDGTHESIIDKEVWDKAQELLDKTKKLYPKYARNVSNNAFMLQGIVKCSNCGSTLSRCTTGSLQCHSYAKGKCGVSHSVTIPRISEEVIASIEYALTTGNFELINKDLIEGESESDILIQKEYEKLDRVKAAYEDGVDTLSEYKTNKFKILESIKHLEAKKSKPKLSAQEMKKVFIHKHKDTVQNLKSKNISEEEKNKLLRSFIDKIMFDRKLNSIRIFYYA